MLGNLQCWGVLLICKIKGQRPTVLAVGLGCLDVFLLPIISYLWEMA